ncbi:TetR/AcrR family transcriptional regulator [Polymorphobacter sp.]|uniref:TetR/AcrR family transcriptional regulator n=1 Tax=Polymorphobacter sp. TaxID=1909290 RepID=UPI003F723D83
MQDIDTLTDPPVKRRRKYTSPAMTERRQRVVDCAHRILGEGGVPSLTIERLSREAEVAPRTIYRMFGDKEGVIFATVSDRLQEVRAHVAQRRSDYSIDVVFAELDWMVSEMRRDAEYARVVIGFYFSMEPRDNAIKELRSVAYNRFRNWLDREIVAGQTEQRFDLERIAQEFVSKEFLVYHRWALGKLDDDQCRIELHSNFLKTAVLVLTGAARETCVEMLAAKQRELGFSDIGSRASTNRPARDAGDDFVGKA